MESAQGLVLVANLIKHNNKQGKNVISFTKTGRKAPGFSNGVVSELAIKNAQSILLKTIYNLSVNNNVLLKLACASWSRAGCQGEIMHNASAQVLNRGEIHYEGVEKLQISYAAFASSLILLLRRLFCLEAEFLGIIPLQANLSSIEVALVNTVFAVSRSLA